MNGDETAIGARARTGVRARVFVAGELCQDCGAPMKEELRTRQGRVVFVWLECSRMDCPGTLLQTEKQTETQRVVNSQGLPPTTRPW